jgi:hypothetical protein
MPKLAGREDKGIRPFFTSTLPFRTSSLVSSNAGTASGYIGKILASEAHNGLADGFVDAPECGLTRAVVGKREIEIDRELRHRAKQVDRRRSSPPILPNPAPSLLSLQHILNDSLYRPTLPTWALQQVGS